MGQCNSTAVECCRVDPSGRPGHHCQEILWQGAPPRPSTTGRITVPEPNNNNPKNTLQVSVSLDQQSEHSSVCIRVELHEGQSLLMDTTFHSTNTPRVENTSSSRSSSVVAETVPSLLTTTPTTTKAEPNKNHYKDIHFTANETKQEEQEQVPATVPVAPAAADMSLREFLEQPRKAASRRSAFRQQQQEPQVVRFASSDGALLRNTPASVKKENSWYNLGYNSGMESAQSLDLANAMQSKNSSGHSTKNSWGGISVQKSMRCVVPVKPAPTANKDSQGKAQFPPIDISMNDISGNTLPTRYDYQDDVSVTEDDDEMDHLWEYHRSVKALTTSTTSSVVDADVAPTTENAAMRRPSTDSGESALSSTASSSAWLGSPPSFISNVSGHGKSRHHRHSSLILEDSKSKILGNGHNSNRSCQSDSYMVVRRRTMSEGASSSSSSSKPAAARTPWNPLQFPAF